MAAVAFGWRVIPTYWLAAVRRLATMFITWFGCIYNINLQYEALTLIHHRFINADALMVHIYMMGAAYVGVVGHITHRHPYIISHVTSSFHYKYRCHADKMLVLQPLCRIYNGNRWDCG